MQKVEVRIESFDNSDLIVEDYNLLLDEKDITLSKLVNRESGDQFVKEKLVKALALCERIPEKVMDEIKTYKEFSHKIVQNIRKDGGTKTVRFNIVDADDEVAFTEITMKDLNVEKDMLIKKLINTKM